MRTKRHWNKDARDIHPAATKSPSLRPPGHGSGGGFSAAAIQQAKQHPSLMNPAQIMFLQRTIGNRAVANLIHQHSPGATQSSPAARQDVIQRKVFIKRNPISAVFHGKYYEKDKTKHYANVGQGDRNVMAMIQDDVSRYFESKDEMEKYANRSTENIGYVESVQTWIRLPPNELTVIGENHTKTTLADIVKAVGTKKFMHEAFTEPPAEIASDENLRNSVERRTNAKRARFTGVDLGPDVSAHYAESFYPKILRGVAGVGLVKRIIVGSTELTTTYDTRGIPDDYSLLALAIRFAATADPRSTLYQLYDRHRNIFDETAATIEASNEPHAESINPLINYMKANPEFADLFTQFERALIEYVTPIIEQEQAQAPPGDREKFHALWKKAENDYDSDPRMYPDKPEVLDADKKRDFSMYQHIKKARDQGFLLYGLGELHLERLENLLKAEGINAVRMESFLNDQRALHPQVGKNLGELKDKDK